MSWDTNYYQAHATAQVAFSIPFIESIQWKGDETVLDLGCGDGQITRKIAEHVSKGFVLGIDKSPEMIKWAKKTHLASNLRFQEGDAESFHFTKAFDWIVSFNALHWVSNHVKVISNVKRALKEKGKILFLMVAGTGNTVVRSVLENEPWKGELSKIDPRFTPPEIEVYRTLLIKEGFSIENLEIMPFTYSFPTFSALVENLMTWVPHQTGFDTEKSFQITEHIAKAIHNHSGTALPIRHTTSMLLLKAQLS